MGKILVDWSTEYVQPWRYALAMWEFPFWLNWKTTAICLGRFLIKLKDSINMRGTALPPMSRLD